MMATVQQIRAGIKARLDTIAGLRTHANMPDIINPPAAVVARRTTTFDTTLDGESDDLTFAVTVFVEWATTRAQEQLDAFTAGEGTSSIRVAINGDPTLGGTVDWSQVTSVERDRAVEWPPMSKVTYLAADVIVEVG
jgi:hypothetical protein